MIARKLGPLQIIQYILQANPSSSPCPRVESAQPCGGLGCSFVPSHYISCHGSSLVGLPSSSTPFSAILGRDSYLYSLPYRLFSLCTAVAQLRHPKRKRKEHNASPLPPAITCPLASFIFVFLLSVWQVEALAYISEQGRKAAVEPDSNNSKKVIFFTYGCLLA